MNEAASRGRAIARMRAIGPSCQAGAVLPMRADKRPMRGVKAQLGTTHNGTMTRCPCGFGEPYESCCGRYHSGSAEPPSATDLMRARYSANARGDRDYLVNTWHSQTRPLNLALAAGRSWTGLQILGQVRGGLLDAEGTVDFRARYRQDGRAGEQRENSRFVREDGRWRYLDAG
jgi:SEC-C motif-containing protein